MAPDTNNPLRRLSKASMFALKGIKSYRRMKAYYILYVPMNASIEVLCAYCAL